MPTYEYECTRCGHRFEEFQSITAEPLKECPKCTGAVKRLIGAGIGIIFKGSGFYTTDYKKSSAAVGGSDGSKSRDSSDGTKDSSNGKSESAGKSETSSSAGSKPESKGSSSSSSSSGSSVPSSSKKA